MKKLAWLGLGLGFAVAAAACGDDGGNTPIDASSIDGDTTDATEIDAVPVTYAGTISLLEAQVLAPGTSGALFGQGIQASVVFTASDQVPAPMMEEQPGLPFGCKAWEYTPAQVAAATVGVNEGNVTFTLTGGQAQHNIPTCVHQAGVGYVCPHTNTAGTGGDITVGGGGTATLTVSNTPYNANNTAGKYISINGATNATNNGVFPIVASTSSSTVTYVNPGAVAETLPAAATRVNLAGVGPIPNAADPGFLDNDNAASFALVMGGGGHFADFTVTTGVGTVGDDPTIEAAEAGKLNNIPLDGSALSVVCSATGCPAGSASGTILNIVTTDGTIPGNPQLFFVMPPPVTKRVQVRCAALQGATAGQTITVPAAYMALIQSSGATRIQATLIRPTLMGSDPVTAIAGHALVGFTTP